ncbi:hypothetical protein CAPTEDRAFT_227778 [Capitella teleta]|uniref:Protein quiver n=1 Tax=Capitella teleta TaxID=283909 RepID=R7VK05_CAPTE|nr:hypothetical protein CAPTEDRAFT_227778 [Capitella teleta]|eukprot:ELU16360.1 hypothetical protein CAPTEDRAFT_227778 [Capitella teleta]
MKTTAAAILLFCALVHTDGYASSPKPPICFISAVCKKLCVIVSGEAISCYSCTGSGCEDEFSSSGVATCTGDYCTKIMVETFGVKSVTRTCANGTETYSCSEIDLSIIATTTCHCNAELCNSADRSASLNALLLMLPALATALKVIV